MRLIRPVIAAALVSATLVAPASAATVKRYSGRTSDGFSISFNVIRGVKDKSDRVFGLRVRVNSYCSQSGPRVFTAIGGSGTLRKDGSFTARGGGVAVRGKRSGGAYQGAVTEFERFSADVCRAAVFFNAG